MEKFAKKAALGLCLLLTLSSLTTCGQSYLLSGNWQPQQHGLTCWAATLSNLTRSEGSDQIHSEQYFYVRGIPNSIPDRASFETQARRLYKFNSTPEHQVLSFESIVRNLNYTYPRPLIYAFYVCSSDPSARIWHLVNIVGYSRIREQETCHTQWLAVFDPKPDRVGSRYWLNYSYYRTRLPCTSTKNNLGGTYYQFQAKNSQNKLRRLAILPAELPNCGECITADRILQRYASLYAGSDSAFKTLANLLPPDQSSLATFGRNNDTSIAVSAIETVQEIGDSNFQLVVRNSSARVYVLVSEDRFRVGLETDTVGSCTIISKIQDYGFINRIPDRYLSAAKFQKHSLTQYLDVLRNRYFKVRDMSGQELFFDIDGVLEAKPAFYEPKVFYEKLLEKVYNQPKPKNTEVLILPDTWKEAVDKKLDARYGIGEAQYNDYQKNQIKEVIRFQK